MGNEHTRRLEMSRLARIGIALAALATAALGGATVMAAEPKSEGATHDGADGSIIDACADMMGRAGGTEAGRKAMQDFMKSDREPHAMKNMMDMARGMGNGDAMLGMTRMMEMMGGSRGDMGRMMGGSDHGMGDMMGNSPAPDTQRPAK